MCQSCLGIKVFLDNTDSLNVGYIVPLPNHYISDMPQGQGLLRTFVCNRLFFYHLKVDNYYNSGIKMDCLKRLDKLKVLS